MLCPSPKVMGVVQQWKIALNFKYSWKEMDIKMSQYEPVICTVTFNVMSRLSKGTSFGFECHVGIFYS